MTGRLLAFNAGKVTRLHVVTLRYLSPEDGHFLEKEYRFDDRAGMNRDAILTLPKSWARAILDKEVGSEVTAQDECLTRLRIIAMRIES